MSIIQRTRRPEHICFGGRQRADEQCSPLRRERGRGFFAPLRMTNRSPIPPTCPVPVSHPARQPHTAGAGGDGGQAMLVPTSEDAIPLTSYLPLSLVGASGASRAPPPTSVTCHLSILNSQFSTLNSQFSILNSQFSTLNSQLSTLNSQLSTLNSQFSILNSHLSIVTCHLSPVTCQL